MDQLLSSPPCFLSCYSDIFCGFYYNFIFFRRVSCVPSHAKIKLLFEFYFEYLSSLSFPILTNRVQVLHVIVHLLSCTKQSSSERRWTFDHCSVLKSTILWTRDHLLSLSIFVHSCEDETSWHFMDYFIGLPIPPCICIIYIDRTSSNMQLLTHRL